MNRRIATNPRGELIALVLLIVRLNRGGALFGFATALLSSAPLARRRGSRTAGSSVVLALELTRQLRVLELLFRLHLLSLLRRSLQTVSIFNRPNQQLSRRRTFMSALVKSSGKPYLRTVSTNTRSVRTWAQTMTLSLQPVRLSRSDSPQTFF